MRKPEMESTLAPLPPLPTLSVQLLAVSVIILQRTIRHNSITTTDPIRSSYDFIVVGSGTSGSIIASRLSEASPNINVLVLEAGGPQLITTDVPSHARQQVGSEIDWGYRTTSQSPNAGNAFDGHVVLPRGRVIGGSHNMNFMTYSRGNRRDYDKWADLGATGWDFQNMLPYFFRNENNTDPVIVAANPNLHSTRGPVVVRTPKNPDPIITLLKQVLESWGIPQVDQNGPSQLGTNYFQQTIYFNATRSTTASAYLEANIGRPNLQVLTRALVTRVLLNGTGSNLRAAGVEYEHNGTLRQVLASREVILSAGSINSPQLLMLSGIGPRDHLTSLGLHTQVDLPVGYHLLDHVFVTFDFEVLDPSLITTGINWTLENMYRYFVNNVGPLSQFPLVFTYLNSQYNNDTDWPDIQIDFNMNPVVNDLDRLVAGYSAGQRDAWREYYRDHVGQGNRMGMLCFHYRPRSVGRLTLNTSNPHDAPLLDTRYLTDPYDVQAMIEVTGRALRMASLPPFNRLLRLYRQPIPGCTLCPNGPIWQCRSYLECYSRAVTTTVGHQVGTCRMGNGTDSVVDPRLRVRRVGGLRVADGSVFPAITNGATNAPCMLIGEYGASMIRQDNNLN